MFRTRARTVSSATAIVQSNDGSSARTNRSPTRIDRVEPLSTSVTVPGADEAAGEAAADDVPPPLTGEPDTVPPVADPPLPVPPDPVGDVAGGAAVGPPAAFVPRNWSTREPAA